MTEDRSSEPIAQWLVPPDAHDQPDTTEPREPDDPTRPLTGLRVGVKELVAVAGATRSANSEVELPPHWCTPAEENPVVTQLCDAGARITCTTTTHEFAWGITTRAGVRVVEHPRLPGQVAGGSSGGSAVAVALGLIDVGVGTDTAGSVRIPAGWCGLVGWKPSFGRLPIDHTIPLAPSFDHLGLITRDIDTMFRTLACLGVEPETTTAQPIEITVPDRELFGPTSAAISQEVVERLGTRGVHVRRVELPDPVAMLQAFATVQAAEALQVHAEALGTWPAQRDRYGAQVRARLVHAETLAIAEVEDARARLGEFAAHLDAITRTTPLLLPTTGCAPPTTTNPDRVGERALRDVVLPHTVPANIAGLPAISLPWRLDGSDVGVQLVGGRDRDEHLLSVALAVQPLLERT